MIKIHVGCGKRDFGPEWIHIDGEDHGHVIDADIWLTHFKNDSADIIYSSHMLEYFSDGKALLLLRRWHGVLKPGSILRIAVPDFEAMARLYITDQEKFPLEKFIGPLYGQMKMNGDYIYHKTCYDFASLSELLFTVGFKKVERYDWRQTEHAHIDDHSQAYLPHMDKEKGNLISLNVEAIK